MQSHVGDGLPKVKKECCVSPGPLKEDNQKSLDTSTLGTEDAVERSVESASNQLVPYNPSTSNTRQDIVAVPDQTENHPSPFQRSSSNFSNRVLPSIGAFTVQCAACFKWRLIPTKEKYEEIRETILQDPFTCERAREWRPEISCDDPADISQDGSRLWAIDKPNIAQPPPGWERLLRIRGEGGTRFADVYYAAPCGKKLRSMVEVERYLYEHPEYIRAGVKLSQFSFQIPRPLQDNYVRKRPQRALNSSNSTGLGSQRPLEPDEVNPIAWVVPPTSTDLQIGGPGLSNPHYEPPVLHPDSEQPPAKKKKKTARPSSSQMYRSTLSDQPKVQVEDYHEVGNASSCDL